MNNPPELAYREIPLDEVVLVGDIWEWKDSHHFVLTVMVVGPDTTTYCGTKVKIWILRYQPNLNGEEGTFQTWSCNVLLSINGWKLKSRLDGEEETP